jgi:hypothetical protein
MLCRRHAKTAVSVSSSGVERFGWRFMRSGTRAALRRQWLRVGREVCCCMKAWAASIRGVFGSLMLHIGRYPNGDCHEGKLVTCSDKALRFFWILFIHGYALIFLKMMR